MRDELTRLAPYTPGLTADQVTASFGVPARDVIKLGSGENPFGPSPAAVRAIQGALDGLHQYPEWTSLRLRDALARDAGVGPEQIVCGAGETELISAVIRAFAEPGDEVLMHRPTFPIYHLYAEAEGRRPVEADGGAGPELAVDDLLARLTERTRVVFLTTPHNPSGRVVSLEDIRRVCAAAPGALVVVDEAYHHFSQQEPAADLLREFENLIVLRTFSKAYGLAGLRVGFGVARPEIAGTLLRITPTWNLGPLQVAGAIAALDDAEHLARTVEQVRTTRAWVTAEVGGIPGVSVVDRSEANFVLLRLERPDVGSTQIHERLAARGLVVKDCGVSYRGLGDRHLRVDIGSDAVMGRFAEALREVLL